MSEPKVTECWMDYDDQGHPSVFEERSNFSKSRHDHYKQATILWREDYEALIKERDEYQKRCRYNLDPGAQITCWDEYESLRARYDAMRKELEQRDAELEELRAANAKLAPGPWIKFEHGEYRKVGANVEIRCTGNYDTEDHGT